MSDNHEFEQPHTTGLIEIAPLCQTLLEFLADFCTDPMSDSGSCQMAFWLYN